MDAKRAQPGPQSNPANPAPGVSAGVASAPVPPSPAQGTGRRGTPVGTPPRSARQGASARSRSARSKRPTVIRGRLSQRTLRRIEPRTVFKISFLFYLMLLGVAIVIGALLWAIAALTGTIHGVDHFVEQLFGYQSFSFASVQVIFGTLLVGLVLVVLGSLINFVLAVVYNLVSDWVGGIEVEVFEQEGGSRGGVASRPRSGL